MLWKAMVVIEYILIYIINLSETLLKVWLYFMSIQPFTGEEIGIGKGVSYHQAV